MRRRGIALVFVLTMTSVIVMMTGAFLAANRANVTSLGATLRQRDAQMAAESAIAFCTYTLEHDQLWAQTEFIRERDISPVGRGLSVSEVPDGTVIAGKVLDETQHGIESTFTVEIQNNLGHDTPGHGVGADRVKLNVVARSGNYEYRRDVMLTGEPVYDAALTAQNDITLNSSMSRANTIHLLPATDDAGNPIGEKNWIRSNRDVNLNAFVGPGSAAGNKQLRIGATAGGQKGVIWAKGNINVGLGNDVGSDLHRLSGDELTEAQRRSGGILAPNSRLNNDIYELQIDDLNVESSRATINMAPGTYRLKHLDLTISSGDVIPDVTALEYVSPSGERTVFFDGRYNTDRSLDSLGLPDNFVASDSDGVVRLNRENSSGPSMTFQFGTPGGNDPTFATNDNSVVKVNGDLNIYSEIDGQVPRVQLADTGQRGVLRSTGSILINGTLTGGGAILADGDVWLQANAAPGRDTSVDVDAGQGDSGGEVVIFGRKVGIIAGGSHRVAFKGLIYAKEDVGIHGGVEVESVNDELRFIGQATPLEKLVLEGAVVAHSGAISIVETQEMYLKYNERYLKSLTKGLYTTSTAYPNCRRIRQLWSRSG